MTYNFYHINFIFLKHSVKSLKSSTHFKTFLNNFKNATSNLEIYTFSHELSFILNYIMIQITF